jgi:hypothetical protein
VRTPQQLLIGCVQGKTSVEGGDVGLPFLQKAHCKKQCCPRTPIVHGFPLCAVVIPAGSPPQDCM